MNRAISPFGALLTTLLGVGACATEETTFFGEPSRVTTSGGQTVTVAETSSSTGAACEVDLTCEVRWSVDIYPAIFTSMKAGGGGCTASNCHESPAGNLAIPKDDAAAAYKTLVKYNLNGVGRYITPCQPDQSTVLCNLKFVKDVTNEFYSDVCGEAMPRTDAKSPVHSPLGKASYDNLVKWIQCGAPLN
jgi:hypothetical protein